MSTRLSATRLAEIRAEWKDLLEEQPTQDGEGFLVIEHIGELLAEIEALREALTQVRAIGHDIHGDLGDACAACIATDVLAETVPPGQDTSHEQHTTPVRDCDRCQDLLMEARELMDNWNTP